MAFILGDARCRFVSTFFSQQPLPTIYPQQGKEFQIRSSKSQRAEIVSVVGGGGGASVEEQWCMTHFCSRIQL